MTGQISEAKIGEVRERTDIVELVSQYVSLKRSGANHMGLCPFHSEKSPSFSVNAARQFFHCFGCGVGGDVFSFLMKIEGLAFPDAVRRLADRVGIELEEKSLSPEEELQRQQRDRLFQVNDVAAEYFHQLLMEHPAGEPARRYLKERGYGRKAAGEYQLGYALESWDDLRQHLEKKGLAAEDIRSLGLIRPSKQDRGDYDLFRGRLIFPIHDLNGRVVAFAGRVLDDAKPKYINSPESPIYHKGKVLFGLYQARQAMRQSGEVLLVEGYFDQLALQRAGFPQVVATCGTALTVDHAHILKRYVQRAMLLFDQDAAGRQATFKAMSVLQEEGVPAMVIELPSGDDPDSFLQRQGGGAFQARLAAARPAMDMFMDDRLAEAGDGVEFKARAAEQIVERISVLSSELEQDLYLKKLAERSGIELDLLKQIKIRCQQRAAQRPAPRSVPVQRPAERYEAVPPPPEEYALPEPPPELSAEPGWQQRSPQSVQQRPVSGPTLSRIEQTLLSLLIQNLVPAESIAAAGGASLFKHPDAVAVAEQVLAMAGEHPVEISVLQERLNDAQSKLLQRLIKLDKEQFAESSEHLFKDCLAAIKRDQRKQQREELLGRIRQVEQDGRYEQMKDLLEEFKNLK